MCPDKEENYLSLLTFQAGTVIKNFLKSLNSDIIEAEEIFVDDEVIKNVMNHPYPIVQLLLLYWQEHELVINIVLRKSFEEFFNVSPSEKEFSLNFLLFLTILPIELLNEILNKDNAQRFKNILKRTEWDDRHYLTLLTGFTEEKMKFVFYFLELLKETKWQIFKKGLPTSEHILQLTIEKKTHFLRECVAQSWHDLQSIEDTSLRTVMILCKSYDLLSHDNYKINDMHLEDFTMSLDMIQSLGNLTNVQQKLLSKFKRFTILAKFCQNRVNLRIIDILSVTSVLDLICKYNLMSAYEDIKSLIDTVYSTEYSDIFKSIQKQELSILTNYFCLSETYEMLIFDCIANSIDNYYKVKLKFLNFLLCNVDNFAELCLIFENMTAMIYLKSEYLCDDKNLKLIYKVRPNSSCSDNDEIEYGRQFSGLRKLSNRSGFISNSKAVRFLFENLKSFGTEIIQTSYYKNTSTDLKERFQSVMRFICEILWRFNILDTLDHSKNKEKFEQRSLTMNSSETLQLIAFHSISLDYDTSDDDDYYNIDKTMRFIRNRSNSILRRRKSIRNKRQRSASFSGYITSSFETNRNKYRINSDTEYKRNSQDSLKRFLNLSNNLWERNTMSKLLGPPECLLIMSLSQQNFDAVRQILEHYNLQDNNLSDELKYNDEKRGVQEKLLGIYKKYQSLERQLNSTAKNKLTNEQRRCFMTAKCFKVTQIINLIESFARAHSIQVKENIHHILNKYTKQSDYLDLLKQFDTGNLNIISICDLIWNMPFNLDVVNSILIFIKRQHKFNNIINVENNNTFSNRVHHTNRQLPLDMGPIKFLENICECMRLLENKTLTDLLSYNTYSLRPKELAKELQRERIFNEIFFKESHELQYVKDLIPLADKFKSLNSKINYFQRFYYYVENLASLVQLRYPNRLYKIEELLQIKPYDLIGELIFDCHVTPMKIEAITISLNLNLIHILAVNICPEMVNNSDHLKRNLTPEQLVISLNYIADHNQLLAYVLRGICNGKEFPNTCEQINSIYFNRLLNQSEIEKLSVFYNNNKILAALNSDYLNPNLFQRKDDKLKQLEFMAMEIGVQESHIVRAKKMDDLILEVIANDITNIQWVSKIDDVSIKSDLLLKYYTKIPTTKMVKNLIESTIYHNQAVDRIKAESLKQLKAILDDITIYAQVSEIMEFDGWPQVYDLVSKTPVCIFERLLNLDLYKLCYDWCRIIHIGDCCPSQRQILFDILYVALLTSKDLEENIIVENMKSDDKMKYLLLILDTFSPNESLYFVESHKYEWKSISLLRFTVQRLKEKYTDDYITYWEKYGNYEMSVLIFEILPKQIRKQLWHLIKYPLLIIEQLIMNVRLELLGKILEVVRRKFEKHSDLQIKSCSFCLDKYGFVYGIHAKSTHIPLKERSFQFGSNGNAYLSSTFILLNFNLYQTDHIISNECIDLLLRIYATKALEYEILNVFRTDVCSEFSTDTQPSLDSLCGTFQIPVNAPIRTEWVRDEDASHCMCCRRAAFTMLLRRHHCRRCGRVVCFACSTHRIRIPELYNDVDVRICNDCHCSIVTNIQSRSNRETVSSNPLCSDDIQYERRILNTFKWCLSGNITHDKLLREEFCYEHSPSVALCLSILDYHINKQKCVDLLIFHCRKFEKLIVRHPEVDNELLAKMINCLAFAAKIRGAGDIVETIIAHSEIIISIVQNGCNSLIPEDPLNNLRKLADALIQAERWDLALDVHLKCGFSTAGVMAAYGLTCLKAGCYETAREKFSHCMTKLTDVQVITSIRTFIFGSMPTNSCLNCGKYGHSIEKNTNTMFCKEHSHDIVKRPQHGPVLLQEILKLLISLPYTKPQPETLRRASIIRNSNTSLGSSLSMKYKNNCVKRMHEPAINVLNTLANLKRIAQGQYDVYISNDANTNRQKNFQQSYGFEECIHYLLTYGSHVDIIKFLLNSDCDIKILLKYFLMQELDSDIFLNYIFLPLLHNGRVPELFEKLKQLNDSLLIWRTILIYTCRYLENKKFFNSLYQLQILLKDPIRASMTCIKFYKMNCENFQQLHSNAQHLYNAKEHLQSELDLTQWEVINIDSVSHSLNTEYMTIRNYEDHNTTNMFKFINKDNNSYIQMTARSLNAHINTINRQLEIAKFLAKCELENVQGNNKNLITDIILRQLRNNTSKTLPTLFDTTIEKIYICMLILLCPKNINEAFDLVNRLILDYRLPKMEVFQGTAKYLARNHRLYEMDKFLNCIISIENFNSNDMDELLSVTVHSAVCIYELEIKMILENLIKRIENIEIRIACHMHIGQLKSAYLLANKFERFSDMRKILQRAEITNQIHIKKLCKKRLQMTNVVANSNSSTSLLSSSS